MKKIYRAFVLVLCVIFCLLSLTSCSTRFGEVKQATAEIDDKNELRLPVCNTDSLNPYEATTEYNLDLSKLLFEGLVKVNEDFTATNVIAKSISQSENVINVHLDSSVKFSDGSSVRAEDVEYSFNAAKENSNFKKQLANFDEISASGDNVTFTLKKADRYAKLCLDFPIVKAPIEDKDGENDSDKKNNIPIGTGKYKFESSQRLIINELWKSADLPKVRRIRLINMLDTASGTESVETGTISYYFQQMNNGTYQRKNVKTHETGMTNLVYLGMNSNDSNLNKAEVRQAISLLVPKEIIAEKSYLGFAQVADTPFYPKWAELKGVKTADKSEALNEAAELLSSAGYTRGDDPTAKIMRLRIIVNEDNSFKVSAAENIETALESVGFDIEIEKIPFEYFTQRLANGEYELYIGETKLTKNMSLNPFFESGGGVSYGIDTNSKIVTVYDEFLSEKISIQRFVDFFDVASPFVPIVFRSGIEMYTNEMTVNKYGTVTDPFENIYTWSY